MGREVRMVPANWEHPRDAHGRFIPLLEGAADDDIAEWDAHAAKWADGFRDDYRGGWKPIEGDETSMSYDEWAGARPVADDYMGAFKEGSATHVMMYEDTSEGTPISPAFATPEELARWLADNEASAFADMTATYEQWLHVCKGGFAPSMVITDARMMSGVEASTEHPEPSHE